MLRWLQEAVSVRASVMARPPSWFVGERVTLSMCTHITHSLTDWEHTHWPAPRSMPTACWRTCTKRSREIGLTKSSSIAIAVVAAEPSTAQLMSEFVTSSTFFVKGVQLDSLLPVLLVLPCAQETPR
jgi:hypothetical protein